MSTRKVSYACCSKVQCLIYWLKIEIYYGKLIPLLDEWELPRDKIILGKEIGSGTFGKVYRGIGNDIVAVNGVMFGECAIKTISEQNANMGKFRKK